MVLHKDWLYLNFNLHLYFTKVVIIHNRYIAYVSSQVAYTSNKKDLYLLGIPQAVFLRSKFSNIISMAQNPYTQKE